VAITCPQCGRQYDVTLFEFGRRIRCDCGEDIALGTPMDRLRQRADDDLRAARRRAQLIIVRHGETDANLDNRLQGQCDTPLSEEGRRQASLVAQRLKTCGAQAIYSSDLKRAVDTARTIAEELKLPVTTSPALREARYGAWEGKSWEEILVQTPDAAERYVRSPFENTPPDAEPLAEVAERVLVYLKQVAEGHAGETVIVVTHGGPIYVLLLHVLQCPTTKPPHLLLANASIQRFETDGDDWRLLSFNDTAHLESRNPAGE